jgi:hypothetical protein
VAANQPFWLKLVLRFERVIGVPIESAVGSDTYFDLLTHANRTRIRLTELTERCSQEGLRLLNLPAGTEIRQLRAQLARVERQLGEIAKDIERHDPVGSRDE